MKIKRMISRILCSAALIILVLTISVGASEVGVAESDNDAVSVGVSASEEGGNFFADLYGMAAENADKIFAILSFIGTLVLALAYKKGLMPSLGKTIGSLTDGVRDMATRAEERIGDSERMIGEFAARISEALTAIEALRMQADELSEKLEAIGECKAHTNAATKALLTEVDMLSDLLLASSIPEYRKEAVERRVADIKKELCDNEARGQ